MKKRMVNMIMVFVMSFGIISVIPALEVFAVEPHHYATTLQEFINNATGKTTAVLYDLDGCGNDEMIAFDEGVKMKQPEGEEFWAGPVEGTKVTVYSIKDDKTISSTVSLEHMFNMLSSDVYITNKNYLVAIEVFEGRYFEIYKYENGILSKEATLSQRTLPEATLPDAKFSTYEEAFYINQIKCSESQFNNKLDEFGIKDIAVVIRKGWTYIEFDCILAPKDDTAKIFAVNIPIISPTHSTIFVNDTQTAFEFYFIDGSNYFKLRDLAAAISGTGKQFDVRYDDATKAVTLTSGKPYTVEGGELAEGDGRAKAYTTNLMILYKDGQRIEMTSYLIGDNNFLKLRDVMRLFDIGVTYNAVTRNIEIDTSMGYTE